MDRPMQKPIVVIDGSRFSDFEGFQREVSLLMSDYTWSGSLDAFDDVMSGGFGTPDGGFVLRWTHSDRSRIALGYPATAKRLESLLATCHPTNRKSIRSRMRAAQRNQGPTLFDEIVEIIRTHGLGGTESDDGVELELT